MGGDTAAEGGGGAGELEISPGSSGLLVDDLESCDAAVWASSRLDDALGLALATLLVVMPGFAERKAAAKAFLSISWSAAGEEGVGCAAVLLGVDTDGGPLCTAFRGVRNVPKLSLRGRGVARGGEERSFTEAEVEVDARGMPLPARASSPCDSPNPATGAPLTLIPGTRVAAVAAAATDRSRPIRFACSRRFLSESSAL